MYHFFVESKQVTETKAIITGSDVNHIRNVLRMKVGEDIAVNDGTHSFYCKISQMTEDAVEAEIVGEEENHELPSRIYLFQGLPKADKMESILQKSVELGVYEVIPTAMKRCVVKLDAKKQDAKKKRWQAIAESAAKQAGRSLIPQVQDVMDYKQALAYAKELDYLFLAYEHSEGMERTRRLLTSIEPGKTVGILIGPEGGFEENEVSLAEEQDAQIITLGKRILRTETAGPAVLAMLTFCLERS